MAAHREFYAAIRARDMAAVREAMADRTSGEPLSARQRLPAVWAGLGM